MSYAIDVNVLLYASNLGSPQQDRAREFLAERAANSEPMCLAVTTLMAFLRISTHPAIFPSPLTWDQAVANLEALLALDHARVIHEQDGFWGGFTGITRVPARGNLVSGAHLATVLKQNGIGTLYTRDSDFRRFEFLTVKNPFA